MKMFRYIPATLLVGLVLPLGVIAVFPDAPRPGGAEEAFKKGNFKDAYEAYRALALDPNDNAQAVGGHLSKGVQCLLQLGRLEEVDEFLEKVIAVHKSNWRLLEAAGQAYLSMPHHGSVIAEKFHRGNQTGQGRFVSAAARDRVRALQLLQQAIGLARDDRDRKAVGGLFLNLASALRQAAAGPFWWPPRNGAMQFLTDVATLPDFVVQTYNNANTPGAPVEADGAPVYYRVPKDFKEARNDGERWRWALIQAAEADPARLNETRMIFAHFLRQQFGTETIAGGGSWMGGPQADGKLPETGPLALHTLSDEETIAGLATGIRRFSLPDEFNYIKILRAVADQPAAAESDQAMLTLASVFQGRRQFPRAAEMLRRSIREHGDNNDNKKAQLAQIVGNWGRFEPVMTQPAGQGATVDFRFRNGTGVRFQAFALAVDRLLEDVKNHLRSSPPQLDWQKIDVGNIGYRVVEQNETRYLGPLVADWRLALKPRSEHFDSVISVATPLQRPGAYLLTATVDGGNRSRIVVWVDDTALVKKPLEHGGALLFAADAATGRPVAEANIELFGYRQRQVGNTNQYRVETTQLAASTDRDGLARPRVMANSLEYQWLITARAPGGRFAHLGFTHIWQAYYDRSDYDMTRAYVITDRPVYRPKQVVKFKFWVARARYDQDGRSPYAGQSFPVEIHNPKGEKVLTQVFHADEYGGFTGEFTLPPDAPLGVYQVVNPTWGGGSFRVEEYKKPEFEVTVEAPKQTVMLGDAVKATIRAKYYFGAPVTEARVKYKVTRTNFDDLWFPLGTWDWLYGPGYWWFAPEYQWYPGFASWGCRRPLFAWWHQFQAPPEVVADAEVPIGADGTVSVPIDTALAKAIHGDHDHRYEITAEVVDLSRRTVVGNGSVTVARQPFRVYSWLNRGYYRVGDDIEASFDAQTLDHKPVEGKGKLKLLKVSYDAKGAPHETPVREWAIDTGAEGRAGQKMKASEPGQYRLSYTVTDAKDRSIEGGYVFTVRGEGFDGSQFRFNDIELVTDRREYQPGEKVRLEINTNRAGGTVALFIRPVNGTYLPPKVLRLNGKSTVEEIAVERKDMPNFFVEALTISNGKVHTEVREVVAPPEKRVLNVEVAPSREKYKPGEKARVKVKLTEASGRPFVGSTVLSVYDKAVEYIAGGSRITDIKPFFWGFRRSHTPNTENSLDRNFGEVLRSREVGMRDLDAYGGVLLLTDGWNNVEGQTTVLSASLNGHMAKRGMMMAAAPAAGPAREGMMMGGMGGMAGARMEESKSQAAESEFNRDLRSRVAHLSSSAAEAVEPLVRKNFADTALWAGSLTTAEDGTAEVSFEMPESLTTWKVKAWSLGQGTRVGQGEAEAVTTKDLLVRLQAPRFFVQKDEVVLSANVHSSLKEKKSVRVTLDLEGGALKPLDETNKTVEVAPGGEVRVDWRVRAVEEGEAVVRMKALTDEESDAMEMRFPVFVHGILKTESWSTAIRPEGESASITVRVPKERRPEETRLEVRYSPTLAGALVDALPYLADYPYGCTEQTLNRFLPTVVTQKILQSMGLDLKAIRDKRTNLNAQQLGNPAERAKDWQRYPHNPVFEEAEVRAMVQAGLQRLADMQLSDGGWGWFSGYGEHSWPHTTALVVHGLQIAKANDVALPPAMLERGLEWLKRYQQEEVTELKNAPAKKEPWKERADDLDAFVFLVLTESDAKNSDMLSFLDRDRTHLSVYSKALFGLALNKLGEREKLAEVLRNISQYLVRDGENQTAYLRLPEECPWWAWYGSGIEANAAYLRLLARTEPKGETAARLAKYLVNNRGHGTYWYSTRDTAFCVEALAEFLKASGEDRPDITVTILVDGKARKEVKITPADLFTFDNALTLTGDALDSGEHKVEFHKSGNGPLYANAYLTNFTLEDPITRAGLEVRVDRKVYKLVKLDATTQVQGSRGEAVDQKVEKYRREPLFDGAVLKSGDLVEVELVIDSKNDYEYLIFEDMKAAGFEPVDVRSGYNGNSLGAYMELRDERVAFFCRTLPRGEHSVSYRLRAEIPGAFSALPARGYAMYAPELKGNSDELKVKIND